jgi:excisionase family DNA binding protein
MSARPPEALDAANRESGSLFVQLDLNDVAEHVAELVAKRLEDHVTRASPWLDVQSAAAHLGCSPERVRKLVARRQIPFHQERVGGRVFLHRRELDEWLLAQ